MWWAPAAFLRGYLDRETGGEVCIDEKPTTTERGGLGEVSSADRQNMAYEENTQRAVTVCLQTLVRPPLSPDTLFMPLAAFDIRPGQVVTWLAQRARGESGANDKSSTYTI